ncbi:MAG: hypothetical protein ACPG7U_01560 [Holosporaceae bacterium]
MNKNHFFLGSVVTCTLSLALLEAYPGDHTPEAQDRRTNPALKRTKTQPIDTPKAPKLAHLHASSKPVNTPQAAALRETNQVYTLTPNSWKSGQREMFGVLAGTVRGLTPRSLSQKRKEAAEFGIRITNERMLQVTHHSPQAGDLAAHTAQKNTTLPKDAHSQNAGDLAISFRAMTLQPDSMYDPLTPLHPAQEKNLRQQFAAFDSPTLTPMKPDALGASPLPDRAKARLQSPRSLLRRKMKPKAAASPLTQNDSPRRSSDEFYAQVCKEAEEEEIATNRQKMKEHRRLTKTKLWPFSK